MNSEPKIEFIDEELLDDYDYLILPDVYAGMQDDMEAIVAFGVRIGDNPAAAVVAELDEELSLSILSLFVVKQLRRTGLGEMLMDRLLSATAYALDPADELLQGAEGELPSFLVQTSYALKDRACEEMEDFLKAVGFTDFLEMGDLHVYDSGEILDRLTNIEAKEAIPLMNLDENLLETLDIFLYDEETDNKIPMVDLEASYVTLVDGLPSAAFLTGMVTTDTWHVSTFVGDSDRSIREVLACAKASLLFMEKERGASCKVLFELLKNDTQSKDFLEGTFGKAKYVTHHHTAAMGVEITR